MKYKNALAVVANYALHKRAFALKKKLEGLLQTILIDSDSGTPCPGADITVDNCGYPGLWNAAFDALIESGRDWLFFIASDVELIEDRLLKLCLDEVLSDKLVSMWTPSVSPDSRASFASCLNCLTPSIRECGAIEGFCFLVRREVLIEVGRIPKWMTYGHGVDMITSLMAHRKGIVIADDRVEIYHPRSKHETYVDEQKKSSDFIRFKSQYQIAYDELLYIDRIEKRYEANNIEGVCMDKRKALVISPINTDYKGGYDCAEIERIQLVDDLGTSGAMAEAIMNIKQRNFSDIIVAYLLPRYVTRNLARDLITLISAVAELVHPGGLITFVIRTNSLLEDLWTGIEDLHETKDWLSGTIKFAEEDEEKKRLDHLVTPITTAHTEEGLCIVMRCVRIEGRLLDDQTIRNRREAYKKRIGEKPKALENYSEWYEKDKSQRIASLETYAELREKFTRTQITVLMPTFNANITWLQEAIDSVKKQIYSDWRLLIVDDCSSQEEVRDVMEKARLGDRRVSVIWREQNGGISAATNTGLKHIETEWVALLDHDDVLAEDALLIVMERIARNPDAVLVYSDEDKIKEDGSYSEPYFKSDWDPVQMEGHNMVSHLGVYKTNRLMAIGGFRSRFDGAQDYDMTLRYLEGFQREQVIHIPHVLYHWRQHVGSTSLNMDCKPASKRGVEVLIEYCKRNKIQTNRILRKSGGYQIERQYHHQNSLVTIIIPTRDRVDLLKRCVESLTNLTEHQHYRIIIVDNGSLEAETLSYFNSLQESGKAAIKRFDCEFNYSMLMNHAAKDSDSELICFLNNDTEIIDAKWLGVLISRIRSRAEIAAVGAKLIYENRTVQHGGVILGLGVEGVAGHAHVGINVDSNGYFGKSVLAHEVSAVTAACMLIRRTAFDSVGGFNEEDLPVAFNDVDLCLRLGEQGFRVIYEPEAVLIHHEGASRSTESISQDPMRRSEINFMTRRWGKVLLNDPYYNPNLSLSRPYTVDTKPRHTYRNDSSAMSEETAFLANR